MDPNGAEWQYHRIGLLITEQRLACFPIDGNSGRNSDAVRDDGRCDPSLRLIVGFQNASEPLMSS
jgi:hypothetical protein